jgi:thiol:disulfide interchange protein DsbD
MNSIPSIARARLGLVFWFLAALSASHALGAVAADNVLQVELPEVVLAPGGAVEFALPVTIQPQYHTMAHQVSEGYVPTELTLGEGAAPGFALETIYPTGESLTLLEGMDPIAVYHGRVILRCRLAAAADAPAGPITLPLVLRYQACTESTCLPPTTLAVALPVRIDVAATPTVAADVPPTAAADTADSGAWLGRLRDAGWAGLLALVFVMGMAMNLTPCVFPILPVTMGFFASQAGRSARVTVLLAAAYVVGMAAVFTILGSAAALAGSQIGWALQSPWGVAVLCLVLAALAASLFGAFEIRVPSSLLGSLQGKSGLIGALVMGAAVGLVAAPCVGPFVAALVIYVGELGGRMAARGDGVLLQAAAGGGLFFVFALGLGLPYLVLGTFTGLISRIPRGGPWLVWVRSLLAFPVLGLILYFLRPYLGEPLFWWSVSALALAAAVYLGLVQGRSMRPWSRGFRVVRAVALAVLAGLSIALIVGEAVPSMEHHETLVWTVFRDGSLSEAREAGRPAVVYVTAAWCVNCRIMERKVFSDDEVRLAVEGVRLLKIDVTSGPPAEGTEAAAFYGRFVHGGPPVVVFYDRRGNVVAERADLGPEEFLSLIRQIKEAP